MDPTYDVAIVGAGSAGCVLAARLSANPRLRVLLLEAGPPDDHPWLRIPAGFAKIPAASPFNWGYLTEPEAQLDARPIYWPRGRVLGGSSAINAMVYLRGHARDYDAWRAAGNVGWGWADVLPLFRRGEDFCGGAGPFHGAGGELGVTGPVLRHPASAAFLAACRQAGVPESPDLNDGRLGGAGFLHFTIRDGVRQSASRSFLGPARGRPNLRIETGALVERIEFAEGRAQAVVYRQAGETRRAAARETVLCAGALNSPQILLLSGVGPAEDLAGLGLAVQQDLPGVGRNLQDHLYVTLSTPAAAKDSLNRDLRGLRLLARAAQYALTRGGPLALGASQISAFVRSERSRPTPDLQINFTPLSYHLTARGEVAIDEAGGFTVAVAHLAPRSRGRVRLASAEPTEAPRFEPKYLSDPADAPVVLEGLRWIRRILVQPAFASRLTGPARPDLAQMSDAELMAFVRASAGSLFHPVGTCAMGQGPEAVTDAQLRVRGLRGLRVADASIMPQIISGPTNACAMMIGERAADLVAEDLMRGR